jgi:two-component system sensor histidine kinase VicK
MPKKHWQQLKLFAGLPEIQIFWVFLPFMAAIFIINILYLPSLFKLIISGLLLAVGIFVFLSAYRAAAINFEAKVERSEFRNIILSLEDALIVYDKNFQILFFNSAAEKLFNLRADMVLGSRIQPQDVGDPNKKLLTQVLFPSLVPNFVIRSKVGEYPQVVDISFTDPMLELRVMTSVVADEKGTLLGFMKIIRDRTKEVSLIRSKNEFITTASHQLRTPINEIKWAIESLSGGKDLTAENQLLLQNIGNSAEKLLNLVEDLLNVSKIEEGKVGYSFKSVDLIEFLSGILAEALPQVRRAGLKLYFDRPNESLPQAIIDPQRLPLVVSNLLNNAVRYNVENGEIIVKVKKAEQGPFLEVSVSDTGIGIPPNEIDRLFAKFFRASNAAKTVTEGSGLGLYIAKSIVQAHGGQIWAESELNRGTTIHFTLPTDPTLVPPKEVSMEY